MMAAIQDALHCRLTGFAALSAVPVYDQVPQSITPECNDGFPFITIGEDTHSMWDTDTEEGLDVVIEIHVWSRAGGRIYVKEIQDKIRDCLHLHRLDVVGCNTVIMDMESSAAHRQNDGVTFHGIQAFRLLIERN